MMKMAILCLLLSIPFLSSLATETLPPDVRNYVDKREGCDHMRGEIPDPSDKQRMRAVNREIRKLCKGTDEKLAQLKKKYAKNPYVMRRLAEFDPGIEEASPPTASGRAARKADH